jgi:hypothetical protein
MPNVLSDVGLGVEPLRAVITLIFVGRHFVGLHHVGPQLGCWYFLRIFFYEKRSKNALFQKISFAWHGSNIEKNS